MTIRKQFFALLTALAVTCSGFSVLRGCIAADAVHLPRKSDLTALLQGIPAQNSAEQFACLCFDAQSQTLLRDGADAGSAFAGFSAADGTLTVSREAVLTQSERESGCPAAGTVSLDEAAERIGCTYYTENGRTTVCSPYQSGTLIVCADGEFDDVGAVSAAKDGAGLYVLHYPTAADAYAACRKLQDDVHVRFAEPDRIYTVCADAQAETAEIDENHGYDAVGCDAFREMLDQQENEADPITVAVIDTGIYSAHDWFAGRIAEGGCSFVSGSGTYEDDNAHGTHCAGIISRCTRENVKILPLKVLDRDGYGSTLQIYCAMLYAAEHGADLVNLSLSGTGDSLLLQEAAQVLADAEIPCIAAAGNYAWDAKYTNPANLQQVIAVAALRGRMKKNSTEPLPAAEKWELAAFSNFGEKIAFSAPGTDILSAGTGAPDAVRTDSGTSMAAPFVTACCANLLDDDRSRTTEQLCRILRTHALDLGEAGRDPQFGWGMVQLGDYLDADESCRKPAASVAGGTYSEILHVTLSAENDGAEIYYTTDGSLPLREHAQRYDGTPLLIAKSTELKVASYLGDACSAVLHESYILQADLPELTPDAGRYDEAVSVTMQAADNKDIYYTLDGSVPDPATALRYTGEPVTVAETAVVCAVAVFGETVSEPVYAGYSIGGEHPERLLHAENNVLTGCYGDFTRLDLTEMTGADTVTAIAAETFAGQDLLREIVLPDTVVSIGDAAFDGCEMLKSVTARGVTTLGAGAFRNCSSLEKLTLGALDAVPDEAFYHCRSLRAPEFETAKIRTVGAYAFADSGFSGGTDLSALESVGSYAFADLKALTLTLPETVRTLPEGVFCNSGPLHISAKGAVKIGKRAFYRERLTTQQIDLPFAKITAIGEEAFRFFDFNACTDGEIVFSSLEQLGQSAFFCAQCRAMSFPRLRAVPQSAFSGIRADVLAFASAESVGAAAICPDMQKPCCVIFSDSLHQIAKDALSVPRSFAAVAAPEDSDFAYFAKEGGYPFRAAPDLYLSLQEGTQFPFYADTLTAIPLGFDMQVTWNAAGSSPELPDDLPPKMVYTCAPDGEVLYDVQASLWKDGMLLRRSPVQHLDAQTVHTAEEITETDQPVLIDWYARYDAAEIAERFYTGYHADFLFTAPHAGEYYCFSGQNNASVTVLREDQNAFQQPAAVGSGVLPEPVYLERGETALLRVETSADPVCSVLYVTENPPAHELPADVVPEQEWRVQAYQDFTEPPAIRLTAADDPETVLKEGRDYVLVQDESPAVGKNRIRMLGKGSYAGVLSTLYVLTNPLAADDPQIISVPQHSDLVFSFEPAESGTHVFWLTPPDSTLANIAENGLPDPFSTEIAIYDAEGEPVRYDCRGQCGCAAAICEMQAGQTYLIAVSDGGKGAIPALELHAACDDGARHLIALDPRQDAQMFGDPAVLPAISLRGADGKLLKEGTDYLRIPLDPVLPGDLHSMIVGMGDYYGVTDCVVRLNYDPEQAVPIELNTPFAVDGSGGIFRLNTDSPVRVRLTVPDGAAVRAGRYAENMADDKTMNPRMPLLQDAETDLNGSCDIVIVPEDGKPHTCILSTDSEQTEIRLASCETEDLVFTGAPLIPKLHLSYDGTGLTENQDYILSYPDDMIRCGSYTVHVIGVNRFTGSAAVTVSVVPPEPEALPLLTGESHTAEITRAGQTLMLRWTAPDDRICLCKESLPDAQIQVFQTDGVPVGYCSGIGVRVSSMDLLHENETYYLAIRMTAPDAVGTVQFSLLRDRKPFAECSVTGETTVVWQEGMAHPAVTVTDGAETLTEGLDYTVLYSEKPPQIGWNWIRLKGMGRYAGEQSFGYVCAPPFDDLVHSGSVIPLYLDSDNAVGAQEPGYAELFSFTAPETGSYYFHATERERCACTVLRYGVNEEILPAEQLGFTMEKGETMWFAVVSDWQDIDSTEPEDCVFGVSRSMPVVYIEQDGCAFMTAEDGTFSVIGMPYGHYGYVLPETVTDPVTGVTARFSEIYSGLIMQMQEECGDAATVYGEAGGNVEAFCKANGIAFARLDPDCTVRGDLSGDGIADRQDVSMLQCWLTECGGMLLPGKAAQAADLDGDGCVTVRDLCEMIQIVYTENPEQ
ncbi:MAG: leucine-rich repeat protein [Oscillospiraceae bacterium]|nr:leucine-rich repeat protein [Oscillospiraceae bacterium]